PNMMSAVHMALAFLIDPRTPKNAGTFRPVTVIARQGTVVWSFPPAPVTLATNHCAQEIAEAIIKALAPACPDRVIAGWGQRFRLISKGRERFLKTKEVGVPIRPGDWFLIESAGGGGYGPPSKRDPAARASDVANGFVTGKSSPRRAPAPRTQRRRR